MKTSADPTRTERLRAAFRAESRRRIAVFLSNVRDVVLQQDVAGSHPSAALTALLLAGGARKPPDLGTNLQVLTNYVNQLAYIVIVQHGEWLRPHMDRAFAHGLRAGVKWAPLTDEHVEPVHYEFAKNEIEGIVDVTVQQVSRAAHEGMRKRERPNVLYQRIAMVVRKIAETRMNMLGHQLIVQQHNLGRIEQIRAAGFTHVGIIPELRPRRKQHDHATVADKEPGEILVNILTAGDDDVCEECEDYAEDGPYELDEVDIPLHPSCRCAVTPFEDARFSTNVENVEEFLERGERFEEVSE